METFAEFLRSDMYVNREASELAACESNLKSIGTACEMWSVDHEGAYPDSLAQLDGDYLSGLPRCPSEGSEPYLYRKVTVDDAESYQVYCPGQHHHGVVKDQPRYSDRDGLVADYAGGQAPVDPNRPEARPELAEPSMLVVVPVDDVAEAHNIMVNSVEATTVSDVDQCSYNLSNIATACDMWSTDHDGHYPESVAALVPDYLLELPKCPAAGKDTYSASMKVVKSADGDSVLGVSLACQGHNHPELEADKPMYDPEQGIVRGPETPVSKPRPTAPVGGEKQSYEVQDGPRAVLDSGQKTLRLAYGPKAQALLDSPAGHLSKKPLLADALRWGDDGVIYLDYTNLEPAYAALLAAARQAAEQGQQEAALGQALLTRLRPRVGPLEGVSCVKVSEQGLHFRATGIGTGPLFVAGLSAAILVPNFSRARADGQLTACKSNLKNIGTALEMWATDHEGRYPESLQQLTPEYLRAIPECPAAGMDTYSDSYTMSKGEDAQGDSFELYCKGHNHAERLEEDFPRYNSLQGILESPSERLDP
jgi:hypothetical protein